MTSLLAYCTWWNTSLCLLTESRSDAVLALALLHSLGLLLHSLGLLLPVLSSLHFGQGKAMPKRTLGDIADAGASAKPPHKLRKSRRLQKRSPSPLETEDKFDNTTHFNGDQMSSHDLQTKALDSLGASNTSNDEAMAPEPNVPVSTLCPDVNPIHDDAEQPQLLDSEPLGNLATSNPIATTEHSAQVSTLCTDVNPMHDDAEPSQLLDSEPLGNLATSDPIATTGPSAQVGTLGRITSPILNDKDSPRLANKEPLDNLKAGDNIAATESSAPASPILHIRDDKEPPQILDAESSDKIETGNGNTVTETSAQVPALQLFTNPEELRCARDQTISRVEDYVLLALRQAQHHDFKWQDSISACVREAWDELSQKIGVFATLSYQGKSFSWAAIDLETREKLSRWTPRAKEYLEDDGKKHLIVQASIWHTIDDKLLSPDWSTRWPSRLWASMGDMKQAFSQNFDKPWEWHALGPAYRCWLMLSSILALNTSTGGFQYDYFLLAFEIARDLEKLAGVNSNGVWPLGGKLLDFDIPQCATSLDLDLQTACIKYWAAWQPRPADNEPPSESLYGFPMQNLMKTPKGDDMESWGKPVQIVVRPCLMADDQQAVNMNTPSATGEPIRPTFRMVHPMCVEVDCASGED
ncbi:hypothetical protein AK830_g12277 [Neonectria ditissima]|uniref:Uncharacterized protein n=1 Tax=Neonectria ditissima TaxID=78410 RepID=A0A0P7B0X1_9HYPO|nr:hypothetical protein AK830_g12277 [Neonectria ditissima]